VVASVSACLIAVLKSNIVNDTLTTAESVARSQMEYIQAQEYDSTHNPPVYNIQTASIPGGYNVTPTFTRIDANGNTLSPGSPDNGLQKINILVTCGGSNSSFTLTDFKVE
jgi:hypothetical protein